MVSDVVADHGQQSPPRMRAYLLGPFKLEVDGKEFPKEKWKSKKALTLFQYLLINRKAHKETVLELLWPEDDPECSCNRLYATVYMLRRMLQPQRRGHRNHSCIRHAHGMYWIEGDDTCWTDVEEFQRLCGKFDALVLKDPEAALRVGEQAIALYRGDLLPEATFEEWSANPRERLRELFIKLTLRTSHLIMELKGDESEAVKLCRLVLHYDPYREEAYQAMISHLVAAGHYAEAAAQYRCCVSMLRDEFGLSPSPETTTLYETMKHLAGEASASLGEDSGVCDTETEGPVACDRRTFDVIQSVFLRQQQRDGRTVALMEVAVVSDRTTDTEAAAVMEGLRSTLRKGDTLCWDDGRALILLSTSEAGCEVVRRRIQRILGQLDAPPTVITYQVFEPMGHGRDTSKRHPHMEHLTTR